MECSQVRIGDIATYRKENIHPVAGTQYHCYSLPSFDNGRIPETIDGRDIRSSKLRVEPGDILVNKLNMRFRRIWLIDSQMPNSICSTEFVPLVPKDYINRRYLYYVLNSDSFTEALSNMRTGTSGSHQRVKPEWILDYSFPLPDLASQEIVSSILGSLDDRVRLNQRINDYLAA